MLWLVLLNIRLAFIALAKRLAYLVSNAVMLLIESTDLIGNLFLLFPWKVDKVIVLCADQERDGGLVEATALPVPFLDGVQGALPRQVEHEEYGNSVVADQGEHVDKLALAAEIPDRKGDFGVTY